LTPAQVLAESETPKMKFPKVVRHRKPGVTIYGKMPDRPFYRIAHRVAGKRPVRHFSKCGEALKGAEGNKYPGAGGRLLKDKCRRSRPNLC
jgi:hypothetical protein